MPASEDRAISDFPIALQLLNTALVLASNPDGLGGYDSVHATLAEIGRVILETQYTQDLGNVDVFDAIKNCRVLSGTSNPTSAQGVDGQIYVKYQTVSNVDTVTGLYVKLNSAWVEIATGGGGGGAPVLYGTTDPTSAQGSDGQLYMKYAYVTGCEVEVTIYKATDARTVSITITENGNTVYSATPSCDIMGAYAEVSTTITLSTGTYSLKHWGVQENVPDVESQFVEIDGNQIGFIADGSNSSYTVDDTETVEVEYGGDMVIATWLKISTDWIPVDDSGAIIDDTSASLTKVYSSAKVQGVFDSHDDNFADEYDATTAYAKGDLCIYNNVLYKAKQATTGNLPTNTTYWEQTSIADEIGRIDTELTANALRQTLTLDNFSVYSAERILQNATKDIPLTQNLFVLFIKSYADARTFGVYLISYHGSVATGQYISTIAQGSYLVPTLSIVDGNKLRIATGAVDVYYSMLRLN